MALLKGNILGNLSGRIGAVSARIVNGKTIIVSRPSSFKVSQSALAVKTRSRFSVTVELINNILEIADFNKIWTRFKEPSGKLRTTIFHYNYHHCDYYRPTIENLISPPDGFPLSVRNADINSFGINIELEAINLTANLSIEETSITLTALLVCFNPLNQIEKHYRIIKLNEHMPEFDFTAPNNISLTFNSLQQLTVEKYKNWIILLTAATKTKDGEIVNYSSTYTKQF